VSQISPSATAVEPYNNEEPVIQQLLWRYATKHFDTAKKIPAAKWAVLEQALSLAPSSYGLQPWRPFVIEDAQVRVRLRAVARNQPQVTEASHFVVLASMLSVSESCVEEFIARVARERGVPLERLADSRNKIIGDVVKGPRARSVAEWTARQAYLALGVLLSSAAQLGIDACPMEGFDPAGVDELLRLPEKGYSACVLCALGYRAADDAYGKLAKVRIPRSEFIQRI